MTSLGSSVLELPVRTRGISMRSTALHAVTGFTLLALALQPVVTGAPASAQQRAESARVSVKDFVSRTDGCYDVAGSISVSGPADYARWEAEIDVTGPAGEYANSTTVDSSGASEGFDALFACFYIDAFGRHRVEAEVTFYDADYAEIGYARASDTFTVRAASTLSVRRVLKVDRGWEVRGSLRATGGVRPSKNHRIRLQRHVSGRWVNVVTTRDGKDGAVAVTYRGPRSGRFRLQWDGVATTVRGDDSAPFRLRRA
ncbi:hypothetical protein ABFT23_13990 [Nocardioides sp. C4-1]|uniref:hypothetical protein n=1 Tax=Nocardioides sp. C4-1 TaxID=3151851 RepID=UPI003267F52E